MPPCPQVSPTPGDAPSRAGRRTWFTPVQFGLGLVLAGYVTWLVLDPADYRPGRDLVLYTALLLAFAACPLIRAALVPADRYAWSLLGIGMVVWAVGDAYYTAVVGVDASAESPVFSDASYLTFFAFAYTAAVFLLIGRTVNRPAAAWVDGVLVACTAGALLGLLVPQFMSQMSGDGVHALLTIATPASDLILVCLLIGILGVLGASAGLMWWLLIAGAALLWVADSMWLLSTAAHEYGVGAPLDLLWLLGFGCFAMAAWLLPPPKPRVVEQHTWSAVPIVVTFACFLLLLVGSRVPIPVLSVGLAASAVVIGLVRTGRTLLAASRHAEVVKQALTDDLTGLGNRQQLALAVGDRPKGALALVDVDGFRQVNDSLGHLAGDRVLQEIAPRLVAVCGGEDVEVARLGGDEFAVFLPGDHQVDHALAIGEQIRKVTAAPMRINDFELQIDMSVGIALAPLHGESLEDLLRAADSALYRAQRTRAGVTVFEPGLDCADRGQLVFLQQLRRAIRADELVCVYQPKIDTRTGGVTGVEALVRWQHPERGELAPAEFLVFAERTTLIRPLTTRVLRLAIRQLGEWRDAGLDLTMSVNLSAMNLLDPQTVTVVTELIAEHHVPPDRLILEITESVFLTDVRRARDVLAGLQSLGCQISIDDYGTGFSSLGQIRALPAQELKLDRSFVVGVAARPQQQSIVSASVLLAHGLGMALVAEGVESQADLRMVTQLGCDLAQGFHICPPLAPLEAGIWLSRRTTMPSQRQPGDGLPRPGDVPARPRVLGAGLQLDGLGRVQPSDDA